MENMDVSRRTLAKLVGAAGVGMLVGGTVAATPSQAAAPAWKVTGTAGPALASFGSALKPFMQARGVTAGQLAVTYKGRLVLAHGYSYSSTALAVQPTSLFRIA